MWSVQCDTVDDLKIWLFGVQRVGSVLVQLCLIVVGPFLIVMCWAGPQAPSSSVAAFFDRFFVAWEVK